MTGEAPTSPHRTADGSDPGGTGHRDGLGHQDGGTGQRDGGTGQRDGGTGQRDGGTADRDNRTGRRDRGGHRDNGTAERDGISRRRGPFAEGDQVQLTDPKGRQHLVVLAAGRSFHTHRGSLEHNEIIGQPEGSVVHASGGTPYVALRPLLADFTLSMKRGAAVVYPKDAAAIVAFADLFPGARVLEAGAGSGALSCWLLRAAGESGLVVSYERRPDFAEIARGNVERFFGGPHPAWQLHIGDFQDAPSDLGRAATGRFADAPGDVPGQAPSAPARDQAGVFDRVVLDMLAPWECADAAAGLLISGGLICCYVATTTQLSATVEALRGQGNFDEPTATETMLRHWHVEGLAVRPEHSMVGHTGFLVTARRLADGVTPPPRRRRRAPGARR